MKTPLFHHPHFSLPVARRRVTEDLLALTEAYVTLLATRGRSLTWNDSFPDRSTYRSAMHRLRKRGLIAYVIDGKHQVLRVTPQGRARLSRSLRPDKAWNKRWTGRWYVLMYDVPEKHRSNRDALRQFLKRLRFGCLQKSVWVTPHDVRPEYDDLQKAACISDYAMLFESRAVLGFKDREVARRAWDFDSLGEQQTGFCLACKAQLNSVKKGLRSPAELEQLAREELQAFTSVMEHDPLLPKALHPGGYQGLTAFSLHQRFVKAVGTALAASLR